MSKDLHDMVRVWTDEFVESMRNSSGSVLAEFEGSHLEFDERLVRHVKGRVNEYLKSILKGGMTVGEYRDALEGFWV